MIEGVTSVIGKHDQADHGMLTSGVRRPDMQDGVDKLLCAAGIQNRTVNPNDSADRLQHQSQGLFCRFCKVWPQIANDPQRKRSQFFSFDIATETASIASVPCATGCGFASTIHTFEWF